MTEPVIEPDPVEREDGELSDDCAEEPTPANESAIERLAAGANLVLTNVSNSSEGEIDRVIAEIAAANGQLAAVETPTSTATVRSMLDPPPSNVDELVEATSNVNLDETSLSELRAAALKSMKRKEDGEISENSPSETAVNEVPRRRKISDRLQIILSPEVTRKKKSPSPLRRSARLESDKRGNSKRRRSTRRERSPLVESYQQGKHSRGRSRSRSRSRSRDRRRPSSHKRARRNDREPKKPVVLTESSSVGSLSWRRSGEEEHGSSRPRGHRSTAEHMSIVLGGPPLPPVSSSPIYSPLPPPPPAPQLLQENDIHCEDNFEVVAMDIDSSSAECSRPPTRNAAPTRNRVGSDADERILRNLLLNQLQKKGGGNIPNTQQEQGGSTPGLAQENFDVERSHSVEVLPSTPTTSFVPLGRIAVKTECRSNAEEEEQYLANKEKLRRLNRLITTREHQIEVLDEEKEKLMRKLDEVMSRMTEFQHEYWNAVTERDALRPVVEEYQQKKIRKFSDADSIRSFTDRLNQRSRQLVAVTSAPPSSQRRPSPSSLDTSDVAPQQHQQQEQQHHQQPVPVVEEQPPPASPDQSMDVDEVPPPASPDRDEVEVEDDEEEAALIELARKKSASFENGEESSEEIEMRLRAVLLEKYRIKRQHGESSPPRMIPISPQPTREKPATPQKNPVQEVVQPEETAASTSGGDETVAPPAAQPPVDDSTRLNVINQRREHVRRVYQNHSLPRRLLPHAGVPLPKDIDRQICQFELTGKCKDVTCEYHHYNDDKLSLREIMSMILSFAPELSGDYQYEGLKKQLDAVISWKEPQEEKADFVRRMLRRLPQTRNDVDARMAQVNDETGDFENYYTSLNIAQG